MSQRDFIEFAKRSGKKLADFGITDTTKSPKYRNHRVYIFEDGYVSNNKTDAIGLYIDGSGAVYSAQRIVLGE